MNEKTTTVKDLVEGLEDIERKVAILKEAAKTIKDQNEVVKVLEPPQRLRRFIRGC